MSVVGIKSLFNGLGGGTLVFVQRSAVTKVPKFLKMEWL